jgi:putative membrane protein
LEFFWGYQTSAPLVILLLTFFVFGAVFCLLAMAPMVFRHRRDISRHKKTITEIQKERETVLSAVNQAPAVDVIRQK